MKKHKVVRSAPTECRVPESIPPTPKFKCIVADPPWAKNQSTTGGYGGALNHYDLMNLERIKKMPIAEMADENAHLYLWVTNSNIDEGLEVVKAWGFRYITMFHWIKPKLGVGNYLRNASETCIFAVRGKMPPKNRTQINWLISYPTAHSEKPREFISIVERVSAGPYLELFCRKRPASREDWKCWGNETEGGADIYIPEYPVPKYSFERTTETGEESKEEV